MSTTTPALWNLLGIYFNQDWTDDYGTEEASVDAFIAEAEDDVFALPAEIDWVLATHKTEAELEHYLATEGNEYLPPADTGGYRGWLTRIAERVENATDPGQR